MKIICNIYKFLFIYIIVIAGYILASEGYLFASESADSWRLTYDLIMRWVNFFIFIFLLIKFLKKPFTEFLTRSKKEVSDELNEVVTVKEGLDKEIQISYKTLQKSDLRFRKMRERIIEQGGLKKQEIIEKANAQAAFMINAAKQKIDGYLVDAADALQEELIDEAVACAQKELPKEITERDNEKLVEDFLKKAEK
ncbi:MAG: hypothetical protein JRJ44_00680 [Deltaproteobacteria bacterium]|nr:hypothetical protein [Deltaproteobacteria bacterium]